MSIVITNRCKKSLFKNLQLEDLEDLMKNWEGDLIKLFTEALIKIQVRKLHGVSLKLIFYQNLINNESNPKLA
jgi:hypothetical protein